MNNSFTRLIDGLCATLRQEVLTRLDDEFARGQVFGVINVLNTFKVRADWSGGYLSEQIAAQRDALAAIATVVAALPADAQPALPAPQPAPVLTPAADLLALRDANNQVLGDVLHWLDGASGRLPAELTGQVERHVRAALDAEVDLELRHAPRPLFSEMSSGRES